MDGEFVNTRFNSPLVREVFGKLFGNCEKFQFALLFVNMIT